MVISKIFYAAVFNENRQQAKLDRNGEGRVQIRLYRRGERAKYKTILLISPKYWDAAKERICASHPNHQKFNELIQQHLNKMRSYENAIVDQHGQCPINKLLDNYDRVQKGKPKTFTAFIANELEITKSKFELATYKAQKTAYNKLLVFRKTIYWLDLDPDFVDNFQIWLKRQGLKKSTVNKNVKVLRVFITRAIKKRYILLNDDPFLNYKPLREEDPKRPYLNSRELALWERLTFKKEEWALERKRDYFLILCYTGLRHGDFKRITIQDHIQQTEYGLIVDIVSQKTGVHQRIPLYNLFRYQEQGDSKVERLLKKLMLKHLDRFKRLPDAKQIPMFRLSSQKLNEGLKLLARRIGSNKRISTHCGRRTFACTLYDLGMPQKDIQRLLGHKSAEMTAIYIQLTDKTVNERLKGIWDKLYK